MSRTPSTTISPSLLASLSPAERSAYDVLNKGHAMTDREVKAQLKKDDMNNVRPRITSLIKKGAVEIIETVTCKYTMRKVRCCKAVPVEKPKPKKKTPSKKNPENAE